MTSQTVYGRVETYRYDAAGNLIQDAKNTYEYDAFRRTSMVTTKAGDVQINRYDAEGLRYEMEENGKLVQFIFNENKEVIAEKEDGNITRLIRTSELWPRESEPEKTCQRRTGKYRNHHGQAETRKSLALLPEWHNSIERKVTIKIPKGTKLNIGKVGPQVSRIDGRCYPGGADQIMIVGRWPKDWIVNDREVMK